MTAQQKNLESILNDFGKRMQRTKQHFTCLDAVTVDTRGFFDDIDYVTILVNACAIARKERELLSQFQRLPGLPSSLVRPQIFGIS